MFIGASAESSESNAFVFLIAFRFGWVAAAFVEVLERVEVIHKIKIIRLIF
jgi:hypothetical protein